MINNSYIVYGIDGKDNLGTFAGERRYNHFHSLKQALNQNWPGIYIPNIPPKKAVGNKDVEFIIERMYFLERFIMQISDIPYLKNSDEMKIFIRPELFGITNEIDKYLQKLVRPASKTLL